MHRFLPALLLVTACARSAPDEAELVRTAQDEARTFFALLESSDCSQIRPMMQFPGRCDDTLHEYRETHSHLSQVVEAKLDGRDKHTVLVTVDVQSTKHEHHWIARVKWTKDGWKVAL